MQNEARLTTLPHFTIKRDPSNGVREVDRWTRASGESLIAYWDKAQTDVKWKVNLQGCSLKKPPAYDENAFLEIYSSAGVALMSIHIEAGSNELCDNLIRHLQWACTPAQQRGSNSEGVDRQSVSFLKQETATRASRQGSIVELVDEPLDTSPAMGPDREVVGGGMERLASLSLSASGTPQLSPALAGLVAERGRLPDLFYLQLEAGMLSAEVQVAQGLQVLDCIGEGDGTYVFRAKRRTGECVAVKVLDKAMLQGQGLLDVCVAERDALVMGREHPFILNLHTAFQSHSHLYLCSEMCGGGDLSEMLRVRKKLPEQEAVIIAAELVLALEHLHRRNVIHRDLKLSNVLLGGDGRVRLADFGLAKMGWYESRVADDDIKALTQCGTDGYMAPEIFSDKPYGKAVDWWCLGCVVMLLMCGKKFARPVLSNMVHRQKPLMLPKSLSLPARDILARLLRKRPEKRLGSEGAEDVKRHEFFANVDWDALIELQLPRREVVNGVPAFDARAVGFESSAAMAELQRLQLTPQQRQVLQDRAAQHGVQRSSRTDGGVVPELPKEARVAGFDFPVGAEDGASGVLR